MSEENPLEGYFNIQDAMRRLRERGVPHDDIEMVTLRKWLNNYQEKINRGGIQQVIQWAMDLRGKGDFVDLPEEVE
jgi:hypothetical protein